MENENVVPAVSVLNQQYDRKDLYMVLLIIAAFIYICLPWYIQLAVWVINLFMPDPVPVLDELLMLVPTLLKIKRIIDLSEFLRKYGKILLITVSAGLIVFILWCVLF